MGAMESTSFDRRARRPRGMTLTECVIALGVLSLAMVAVLQLVGASSAQRRLAEQRRVALQEVANQAERLAVASWDELAADSLTTWTPSDELAAALPDATCRVEILDLDGPLATRQVRLFVAWQNAAGQDVKPVELTIWRFQPEEGR
jgi:prepilin-type N-terminal cleavage/methylation domain-containing protein